MFSRIISSVHLFSHAGINVAIHNNECDRVIIDCNLQPGSIRQSISIIERLIRLNSQHLCSSIEVALAVIFLALF